MPERRGVSQPCERLSGPAVWSATGDGEGLSRCHAGVLTELERSTTERRAQAVGVALTP